MEKQKLRDEIEEQYKWDLTGIYKDKDAWENDYEKVNNKIDEFKKYKGKILDSSENLYDVLNLKFSVDRIVSKLYIYAKLQSDVDINNSLYQNMQSKALNLSNKEENAESYIFPEILKGDYSLIQDYCNNNQKLNEYKFFFEVLFRDKDHILSDKEEQVLSNFSNIINNFSKGSNFMFTSEVKFRDIEDENGKKVSLTPSNLINYIKSNSREVRKNAYISSREGYQNVINTISSNFIGKIQYDEMEAKMRGFNSCLEKDLHELNISKNVVDNLIKVGNDSIDVYQKYLKTLKMTLNVDKLEPWDLSMPLSSGSEKEYSYNQAKDIILNAFNVYGNEYADVLKKAFKQRWIDVLPSNGKDTGWYSWGHYDSYPVVLANFNNKLYDVSALAHELGHLVHNYLNVTNNSYIYGDHSILEAEVASLTNEIVLSMYLKSKSNDSKEKLSLLNNIIDVIISNFFGTVKGTEFLIKIHDKANKDEVLTSDIITSEWKNIVDKYNKQLISESSYINWVRIPHYYRQYYYYKYATGISAAVYNAKQILSGDKQKVENYLKFLKAGGKDYPKNNLMLAGINIEDKAMYEETVKFLDEVLDEFIEIYNNNKE